MLEERRLKAAEVFDGPTQETPAQVAVKYVQLFAHEYVDTTNSTQQSFLRSAIPATVDDGIDVMPDQGRQYRTCFAANAALVFSVL
jgi:hypothetical protein